jgi:hypothetical protein
MVYIIIFTAFAILLGVFANKILTLFPKIKPVFVAVLSICIVALAYFTYESIMQPIRFNSEKDKRFEAVKKRLIIIKDAEFVYEEKYGKYTADWDVLVNFIKNDSVPFVRINGELIEEISKEKAAELAVYGVEYTDTAPTVLLNDARGIEMGLIRKAAPEGLSEAQAVQLGFVIRDTTMIPVYERLFPKDLFPNGFDVDNMMKVPFNESEIIKLQADIVVASASKQPVFEASIDNVVILKGLDEQLIINLNDELKTLNRYQGLKIGDITAPNGGTGNWDD